MGFLYTLGLLGLLSILVLILIYIIKPKYHDKAVSSTFIWHLSLKYQKRKMPLQWLKRSLLFILQLLILTSLALMLARPYITLDSLSGEKVIILDASASMLTENDGETRFDRAVEEIIDIVERKNAEDRVTVILAGDEPVYVVRRDDSTERIKQSLSNIDCSYGQSNIEDAMSLANSVLDENSTSEVILYTDINYAQPGYVTVENMADSEWNAAVMGLDIALEKGYYKFVADIASYGDDANLSVSLYVDNELKSTKNVSVNKNETVEVTWWNEEGVQVFDYSNASVVIDVDDSFGYDDELFAYGDARRRNIELVSQTPNMLNMALLSNSFNSVYQAPLKPTPNIEKKGYDVYIYEYAFEPPSPVGVVDGNAITTLPEDGALLLINPKSSIFGLKLGNQVSGNFNAKGTDGISRTYQQLMNGISPENIQISKYTKVISYEGYEVLMTCNGDPVMLAKDFDGVKVVALMFDIHQSDLPMLLEFPVLINNMCEYGAPPTLWEYTFDSGEEVEINAKPNATSINVLYENGIDGEEAVSTDYEIFPIELKADRPGTYTVTQSLSNGNVRTDKFYVRTATEESDFSTEGGVLAADEYQNPNAGIDGEQTGGDVRYNTLDLFKYIAIFLLLLLVVEWGVQYREQF